MNKMKLSNLISNYLAEINWKMVALSTLIGFGSSVSMVLCNTWIYNDIVKNILLAILSSISVAAFLFGFWEMFVKKSFAKEILKLADISNNISLSGIEYIYSNFRDIDWREIIRNCDNLTIVVSYAESWRKHNYDILKEIPIRNGALTVYLPNYNDLEILKDLGRRFGKTPEKIKELIIESANEFYDIDASVFIYDGTFQSSYYVIDEISIMSFFNHHKEPSTVPALKVNSLGSFNNYIKNDIEKIKINSIQYRSLE